MTQTSNTPIDFDREVEAVDSAIVAHKREIEELISKRYELIAQKSDLDMQEVVECLFECDLDPKEVMEFIVAAKNRKLNHPG